MSKKYYLAGPMTGVPFFNVPLFDEVTAHLRAAGMDIISPAELDSDELREIAMRSPTGQLGPNDKIAGASWGDLLARDVRIVADQIDGIIFLPRWWKSRGAKLEAFVGVLCSKEFHAFDPETKELKRLDRQWVLAKIQFNMATGE